MPSEQPALFEFAVNLKTAKALGLTIPETSLQHADEIKEKHSTHVCSGPERLMRCRKMNLIRSRRLPAR